MIRPLPASSAFVEHDDPGETPARAAEGFHGAREPRSERHRDAYAPVSRSARAYRSVSASSLRPTSPALRANPCPEVTDPVCRLPLPTLFRRPEAANLGDLLRIRVRPGARLTRSRRGFQGPSTVLRTPQSRGAFGSRRPFLRANRFRGHEALQRKENSSQDYRRRPPLRSRHRTAPLDGRPFSASGFGNVNPIPFRQMRLHYNSMDQIHLLKKRRQPAF